MDFVAMPRGLLAAATVVCTCCSKVTTYAPEEAMSHIAPAIDEGAVSGFLRGSLGCTLRYPSYSLEDLSDALLLPYNDYMQYVFLPRGSL